MIFKKIFFLIGFGLLSIPMFSQVEEDLTKNEKPKLSDRLVFGGDFGLSFGTITYVNLEPIVGYKVTDRLTVGLGPIYIFEKYKDIDYKSSTYGGKATFSFTLIKGAEKIGLGDIILYAENELINIEPVTIDYTPGYVYNDTTGRQIYVPPLYTYYNYPRIWIDNFLAGGGISQPIGRKGNISLLILWDITKNKYSPYTSPIFRVGFYL